MKLNRLNTDHVQPQNPWFTSGSQHPPRSRHAVHLGAKGHQSLIKSFPPPKRYTCTFVPNLSTGSEVNVRKKAGFSLSRMVTLEISSRSQDFNQLFIVSQ